MRTNVFCRQCNEEVDFILKPRPDTPHEAEIRCEKCGNFLGWKGKEKNNEKRPKNKVLPSDLNIDYCQLCLRKREHLGYNETLTSHHICEIQHGGQDVKENIWVVCSHCHALVHHVRTYINEHFKFFWEKYEQDDDSGAPF